MSLSAEAGLSQSERIALAARGYADPGFFCRYFLEKWFPKELNKIQRGILAILTRKCDWLDAYGDVDWIIKNFVFERDGKKVQIFFREESGALAMLLDKFTLVMIPRGFSKTTLARAVITYDMCYDEIPFGAYISETGPHASKQLGACKWEFEENIRIRTVFGNRVPAHNDSQQWGSHFIELLPVEGSEPGVPGSALVAMGRGGQIRGSNHKGSRPKKQIWDDLEDKDSVDSDEQREKAVTWAYGDAMPALPELDPDASIIALATLLHKDALVTHFEKDPDWTVVKFSPYDCDGELIWPEMLDEEKLTRLRARYARVGKLDLFYMEYYNQVRNEETAIFKAGCIITPEHPRFLRDTSPNDWFNAVYCDPAISEKKKADEAVIAVVGIHQKTGRIRKQDEWGGQGKTPREIIDNFFRLAKEWSCAKHGIEANAFQKALVHLVREEMFRKKQYFEIEAITHSTNKFLRIKGILQPRYAALYIEHLRVFPEYETQMFDFSNGTVSHDDRLDATAGAIALLDPYAAFAADPSQDLTEDTMEPLEAWGSAP